MESVSAKIPVPLRPRAVAPPSIREHRIPTPGSKPYIAVEGRDGCLWFCESGTSKIGRLDPKTYAFKEFDLPSANATPIGIVVGPEGDLWFAEKSAGKIGRITMQGKITEFALPTPNAGPDAIMLGPDGNIWFSETEVSQIGRITPEGKGVYWYSFSCGLFSRFLPSVFCLLFATPSAAAESTSSLRSATRHRRER
jgi:streptogramin lyase